MTNAERILQLLIHDVRTPVGVAQGYVRLLQDHRLESDEDRARALSRTMDALGNISRICDDVTAVLNEERGSTPVSVTVTALADSVETKLRTRPFLVKRQVVDPAARVSVLGNMDRLANAIGVLMDTVAPPTAKLAPSLHIETRMSELRFVATPGEVDLAAVPESPPVPFDPWRAHGLAVPLACQVIDRTAGRVLSQMPAIIVALPLETLV